jgi:hypothetical protein
MTAGRLDIGMSEQNLNMSETYSLFHQKRCETVTDSMSRKFFGDARLLAVSPEIPLGIVPVPAMLFILGIEYESTFYFSLIQIGTDAFYRLIGKI